MSDNRRPEWQAVNLSNYLKIQSMKTKQMKLLIEESSMLYDNIVFVEYIFINVSRELHTSIVLNALF